ncbi:RNA 2',3'-cyclic phosphodiesterase [bacterium]|nr:RNA 2',3'-cyclic phosphodiesterase [bacterium]
MMSNMNKVKHRIFIAINLPKEVKDYLVKFEKKHFNWPVRWTKPCSLHITLVFIGYVNDVELEKIKEITKQVVCNYKEFDIVLEKICQGPINAKPRMIWVLGKKNDYLSCLKEELENAFISSFQIPYNRKENREFFIHITLARAKGFSKIPAIDVKLDMKFKVNSIEIMESRLLKDGAEYDIVESFKLSKTSTPSASAL